MRAMYLSKGIFTRSPEASLAGARAAYAGARSRDATLALSPDVQDFDAWLTDNASRIPVPE